MNAFALDPPCDDVTEPDFPHVKLASLDEKISNLRWVVPVLPEQELECLLQASIDLAKKGIIQYYLAKLRNRIYFFGKSFIPFTREYILFLMKTSYL